MRKGRKNAILSHEVISGMEVKIDCIMKKPLFQFLNNAFSDRLVCCQVHSEDC